MKNLTSLLIAVALVVLAAPTTVNAQITGFPSKAVALTPPNGHTLLMAIHWFTMRASIYKNLLFDAMAAE